MRSGKLAPIAALLMAALAANGSVAQTPAAGTQDGPTVNAFVDALTNPVGKTRNHPARETWLQDNGFGIFVSLGVDTTLGLVMSHSLVGASEDYASRYFSQLPTLFDPRLFDAGALARLIRASGARYSVLTTKHHSGFALWDSAATDFDVTSTPYGKDIVDQFARAVRNEGLGVGLYYSPEDFHWARQRGITDFDRLTVQRDYAPHKAEFDRLVQTQIGELFGKYGPIDIFFNDGEVFGTTNDKVWDLQPNTLITRTAIPTPEQTVPSLGYDRAWESIITTTDQWNYKPNDVDRKTPRQVLNTLIETRAKGGALMINLSIKPDGSIPTYDDDMLRTIGAWNFINGEAIFNVRPWVVTHEQGIWFTRTKDGSALYAVLSGEKDWAIGERRQFLLRSVTATPSSRISVLGASGRVVEYRPDLTGKAMSLFEQTADGLKIDIMRTQRIYNDYTWPYPLVVKLEGVEPALDPPAARTLKPVFTRSELVLNGQLIRMGDQRAVEVAFQHRPYGGFVDDYAESTAVQAWQQTPSTRLDAQGTFSQTLPKLKAGTSMVYRAVALHPSGLVM